MADKKENLDVTNNEEINEEQYSLNDDRRVKVLSPGQLVAKRFFRNRIAVVGLSILIFMFVFSFIGGAISPYEEDQLFYRYDVLNKEVAGAAENTENRYIVLDNNIFDGMVQANSILAISKKQNEFSYSGKKFTVTYESDHLATFAFNGKTIALASKDMIYLDDNSTPDFELSLNLLKSYYLANDQFNYAGSTYAVDESGTITKDGSSVGYISNYIVNAISPDIIFTRQFKEELRDFLEDGDRNGIFVRDGEIEKERFNFKDQTTGEEAVYCVSYNAAKATWLIRQETVTYVYDKYAAPCKEHWLGTDGNGMDMLTRLMYGGRVSLVIGFIVVLIETTIGVIFGGISGFFGGWVDNLIMRIVDVLYCIPSTPLLIIIGAAMDAMNIKPQIRMIYLMLILGFLGWPGVARMVRGQILSLREQEFMTAAEATGLSTKRRIFKHLIPNVIPQLIVSCTMGIGGTILTEATLSFLGLGVRFPFASWGNIINDVSNTFVLTTYLWVWIPAGCCILLTVLAFNLLGDGLRDAFDPKMKR